MIDFIAAAVSDPEANEQGSSLIGVSKTRVRVRPRVRVRVRVKIRIQKVS